VRVARRPDPTSAPYARPARPSARTGPARAPRAAAAGARGAARARRHERILAAAEHLFAAQGFAKTTVDEIAAAAGVSKGLVYDHYASKEDLLSAVWTRQVDAWRAATRLRVKHAEGSFADAIGEMIDASIRHARENPLLRRILEQDPGSFLPHTRQGIAAFAREYRDGLERALRHGVRCGELRRGLDVPYTAELIWLTHFWLVRELFLGPDRRWRADGDALLRAATALVVAGLKA
jgi:AcrR family transcriptional regulator